MDEVIRVPQKSHSARTLLLWGAAIAVAHLLAVGWHLVLLVRSHPETPRFLPPLLILMNLLPVAGVAFFAKGFGRLAGLIIVAPLATGLVAGGYAHFLSPGTDNIFHMPPGGLTEAFQASAVLLVLMEIFGGWIGIRMFLHASGD